MLLTGLCFPRLPQRLEKALCKAGELCEKYGRHRMDKGLQDDVSSTEDASSTRSTSALYEEEKEVYMD